MLKYLIILLDDTSVSYCHYDNRNTECRLIGLDDLKEGILFAMKENLNIQFVYPEHELPEEYRRVIETIDHTKIAPCNVKEAGAEVMVVDGISNLCGVSFCKGKSYVLRCGKEELLSGSNVVAGILGKVSRLNVVITDVDAFSDTDFGRYGETLGELSAAVEKLYSEGRAPQLNILTDRMMLQSMNNCGAGDTNVTLAPDGRFYVCPAFYLAGDDGERGQGRAGFCIGDLKNGLDIRNPQLYRLDHAPLCRHCDAYQCKRCVWLNRKTTYEVNTPSHEQCVVAHIERNASRELLKDIRKHGTFMPEREDIKEIDYLDPFDKREEW